jgi:CheY-like chemotaxis protein
MEEDDHEFVDESARSSTTERFTPERSARSSYPDRPGSGLKVLVVDDDVVHRRIVYTIFEGLGCTVTLAANRRTALAAAEVQAFDLVIMDRHMQGPSGNTIVRRLRRGDGPSRLAYVVCHSSDPPSNLFAGYDGVVAKPLTDKLAVALLIVVRLHNLGRPLAAGAVAVLILVAERRFLLRL